MATKKKTPAEATELRRDDLRQRYARVAAMQAARDVGEGPDVEGAAKAAAGSGYSVHLSVRLHADLLARLDALVSVFEADAALAPTGRADRSDVLRAALAAGLVVLERDRLP